MLSGGRYLSMLPAVGDKVYNCTMNLSSGDLDTASLPSWSFIYTFHLEPVLDWGQSVPPPRHQSQGHRVLAPSWSLHIPVQRRSHLLPVKMNERSSSSDIYWLITTRQDRLVNFSKMLSAFAIIVGHEMEEETERKVYRNVFCKFFCATLCRHVPFQYPVLNYGKLLPGGCTLMLYI